MWEKEVLNVADRGKLGITPTCVGKRRAEKFAVTINWDHSHVCGKKWRSLLISTMSIGSLPRVWEKVQLYLFDPQSDGITPTCVGKRLSIHGQNKHFEFILS